MKDLITKQKLDNLKISFNELASYWDRCQDPNTLESFAPNADETNLSTIISTAKAAKELIAFAHDNSIFLEKDEISSMEDVLEKQYNSAVTDPHSDEAKEAIHEVSQARDILYFRTLVI